MARVSAETDRREFSRIIQRLNADVAGNLMDLYVFDPRSMRWMDLSGLVTGSRPSPRDSVGLTSANQKLYLYGGNFQLSACLMLVFIIVTPDSFGHIFPDSFRGLGQRKSGSTTSSSSTRTRWSGTI